MYQFLNKYGQTLAFGLGLFVILVFLAFVFGGLDDFNLLDEGARGETAIFDFGLKSGIGLTLICAVLLVGFGLFQIATNLKSSMKGILSFVLVAIVFAIAWGMADDTVSPSIAKAVAEFNVTGGQLKFIGGSMVTAIIMSVSALALLFLFEIRNFFK